MFAQMGERWVAVADPEAFADAVTLDASAALHRPSGAAHRPAPPRQLLPGRVTPNQRRSLRRKATIPTVALPHPASHNSVFFLESKRTKNGDSCSGSPQSEVFVTLAPREIQALAEENERLEARVAVAAMEGTATEKGAAQAIIEELQATVKNQEIAIRSLTISRDTFQNKCSELMKQVTYWKKQAQKMAA
jgi:hypothetical protein